MALHTGTDIANLAWAAGFIDGEGCIHIAKQRYRCNRADTYRLSVFIGQNDLGVLKALREAVGIPAPIYEVKRAANHTKQCFSIQFNGRNALRLLLAVGHHLRRKRLEAEAGLRFWIEGGMGIAGCGKPVDPKTTAAREHYYCLMRRLK